MITRSMPPKAAVAVGGAVPAAEGLEALRDSFGSYAKAAFAEALATGRQIAGAHGLGDLVVIQRHYLRNSLAIFLNHRIRFAEATADTARQSIDLVRSHLDSLVRVPAGGVAAE